ncbi:hypothetical protein FGG79_11740 [Bacillus sp. BHET2]|uniref:hypothetical protein n=1 Tax=Bacillus sp. BHET2 TaxID=2583818 RepID=UPI00110E9136|nr:hypothetical protein [Bacillus sp. BHET2]TMU85862.1 hypothetical protein FGG79_11740 [Bacillus sp. BHET2]
MEKQNYQKRLEALKKRRQDDVLLEKSAGMFIESYEYISEGSSIKYVLGAMKAVDKKSTDITLGEGERIKNQLDSLKDKGFDVEYKYQGSVTNNTHIRAHSDIDILTIHKSFVTLESPLKPSLPYQGNPVNDLCDLREASFAILKKAFPAADVDNAGAKSIGIQGGSLRRKVDVVPSNWYDTIKYRETRLDYYRGVMVLNYKEKTTLSNTPFYHNKLLDDKDTSAAANFKKIVRLLKTLKADSEHKINLSSYDIAALMYHMEDKSYWYSNTPLKLLENSLFFLKRIYEQDVYRNSLLVPDGSRGIFQKGRAAKEDLSLMIIELMDLYEDVLDDLKMTGGSINKEIIA